jgi:hypothetical protein
VTIDFGDFVDEDAWAEEGPDPEQVARKLRQLFDRGHDDMRVATLLIAWLRRQGALRD